MEGLQKIKSGYPQVTELAARFPMLLLLFVVGVVYLNALGNGFAGDDHDIIVNYELIRDVRNIPAFFMSQDVLVPGQSTGYYRPLGRLPYMLDYYLWGMNPFGYHALSVGLHAAVVLAWFAVLRRLYPLTVSLIASLLFAVNPIQAEAVTFISGRNNVQVCLFLVLALYGYLRYEREGGGLKWRAVSLLCFGLALLTKEFAIVFPLALLLFSVCFPSGENKTHGGVLRPVFPYLLPAVGYLAVRYLVVGTPQTQGGGVRFDSLVHGIKSLFTYFHVALFPLELKVAYFVPDQEPFFNLRGVLALAAVAALTWGGVWAWRHDRRWFFPLGWFVIFLLPVSGLVVFSPVPVAERYVYVASMGIFLVASLLLHRLAARRKRVSLVLALLLILVYGGRTMLRNLDWKDDVTLGMSTVRSMPQSALAHYQLGNAYEALERLPEASAAFERSVALDPGFPHSHLSLGKVYVRQGRLEEGKQELLEVLAIMPEELEALDLLAFVCLQRNELDEAIRLTNEIIRLRPDYQNARANLQLMLDKRARPFQVR